jgi:two-component system, NtrC family, sensor kinase
MRRRRTPDVAALRQPRFLPALVLLAILVGYFVTHGGGNAVSFVLVASAAVLTVLLTLQLAVTSRSLRHARSDFAEEHRRLQRIFMDAPIPMTLNDADGRWQLVNPALCRMLDYREEEVLGRHFTEFTHPDDVEMGLKNWKYLREGTESRFEYEKRYIAKDGREIWALVGASVITDWDEESGFMIVQMQDITERKRAEIALAEERQLLTAFLETTPDQVYFKDLASRFMRVSNVQAARLGFHDAEDAIGKTDFDAFSDEHARQAFEDEQRIIRTRKPIFNLEERETYIDGREAWVSTTKMPLRDATGTIVGTFGVSTDITARKRGERLLLESEERWRTLLANSQDIVMLVDAAGRLTYTNPAVERWLGYEPDELTGSTLTVLAHTEDQEAVTDAFARACGAGRTSGRPEIVGYRAKHADGSWHMLEATLVCLLDDPAIGAVLVASRDVSERAALEQERERLELERRVSQRLEAVGQLSAGIAHEINTPLQFVGDSVTFLREAVDELLALTNMYHALLHTEEPIDKHERQRRATEAEDRADVAYLTERIPKAFERTVDGIARVRSIVQAMKRFSHPSGSDSAPSDLNEALETTLAVCRNEYKYVADVELDLGQLPLIICNIGEINQVLLNLIINAAQAIGEKVAGTEERGTIHIRTRVEGDEAVIEIGDDGPGIPAELQDRIYEPFFTTKEIGKGSGQGLALARTTVEQHGGSIGCNSTVGDGTTFAVRLPLRQLDDADVAEAA